VLLHYRDTDQGPIVSLVGGYAMPVDEGRDAARWRTGNRQTTRD
jgi:hypothetical protein